MTPHEISAEAAREIKVLFIETHQGLPSCAEIAAIISKHFPIDDTRRLDWLEKTESKIDAPIGTDEADSLWFVNEQDSGATVRQAIDAAMKGQQ